ncbi:MAG: HAMP domain-containing sensor histidine kinase [Anaerolineae bacterium]
MQQPGMNLTQALEVLKKLESAAPQTTANKLAGVADLLRFLADENDYLHTQLLDNMYTGGTTAPAPTPSGQFADHDFSDPSGDILHEEDDDTASSEAAAPPESFQLFAGINDAMRPPLVAIRGRSELVQGGFLGQITPEQDSWLESIQDNTKRAFAVLDAVQEMIAIQQGKVRIEPVNFLSSELLTEAWERVRDKAKRFNHDVTVQAPDLVPLARGDFYQSLIVLTDLVDNALLYTAPGGNIRLSVDNLGTHVLVSVADNGVGITEDDMEQIGKPFWRGTHHKLVRAHAGTGLRLHIAKQMLALQDGELIFSGEPGVGSTFSFTLPIPE